METFGTKQKSQRKVEERNRKQKKEKEKRPWHRIWFRLMHNNLISDMFGKKDTFLHGLQLITSIFSTVKITMDRFALKNCVFSNK